MIPTPSAIGLTICDQILIEEGTRRISLIGVSGAIRLSDFPAVAPPFGVFSVLTGGRGDGTLALTITQVETDEEIYRWQHAIRFADRLANVHVVFRIRGCRFPAPGLYLVTLLVDSEWVAQRRIRIIAEDET